ncbi:MAG: LD-carboxypeptidase [Bacteroidales bacterium]|nr:LD-carboxypeptidase [Bacteroidales bacterium]
MVQPPFLKTGDTISIVAPASCITKDEILTAAGMFASWGLNIVYGKNMFRCRNSFAGTDSQRISDFQEMLDNPDVKAIICARGGYGSIRILDRLKFDVFRKHPKWIAGCSDICAVHAAIQQLTGTESIHAVMPRRITSGRNDLISMQTLKDALFGNMRKYDALPHAYNRHGKSEGILTGGNLSVLFSLRGTAYDLDTDDKILFLEDVHEYLYHVDRMITNLKISHKLERLKGLVIGGMNGMKTSSSGFTKPAYDIIKEAVAQYHYPVMFGIPSGHVKPNKALVFGRYVNMNVGGTGCNLVF